MPNQHFFKKENQTLSRFKVKLRRLKNKVINSWQ